MQIKRQANSTSRAKALVDKTKDLFSAFTNALKYSENKVSPITPPTFEERTSAIVDYEHDQDLELFYPVPPFFRRFTSNSQRSGSAKSTSTAPSSIFSHHTYQTATTVAGEGTLLDSEKEDVTANEATEVRASGPALLDWNNLIRPNKRGRGSFSLRADSSDDEDSSGESSEDEEGEGEDVLFMRSKRVASLQPVFATSLSHNPYAAFLSQPSYKPAYIFPTARRFVDTDNA